MNEKLTFLNAANVRPDGFNDFRRHLESMHLDGMGSSLLQNVFLGFTRKRR